MQILLTRRCMEACAHCSTHAVPTAAHMDEATWQQTQHFLAAAQPRMIQIGGGEPTLHPHWASWVGRLARRSKGVVIMFTNGSWIDDVERTARMRRFLRGHRRLQVQLTVDERWYPNAERRRPALAAFAAEHQDQIMTVDVDRVEPFGRALTNAIPEAHTVADAMSGPQCTNTYLAAKQIPPGSSFRDLISFMETRMQKFGKPLITEQGNILTGESIQCEAHGTVWSDGVDIVASIRRGTPHGKCGVTIKDARVRNMIQTGRRVQST